MRQAQRAERTAAALWAHFFVEARMTRYIKAAAVISAAITLGACASNSGVPVAASTGVSTTPLSMTRTWAATISPQAGTNISGTAAAVGDGSRTQANISLGGGTAGEVHPWHIHVGQCGDNGPIFGPAANYQPLTVGADGTATASAVVPIGLVTTTRYYVNVHQSPTAMGIIVACGNLTRAGM